jgi:vancomycin permeability regulator SanA
MRYPTKCSITRPTKLVLQNTFRIANRGTHQLTSFFMNELNSNQIVSRTVSLSLAILILINMIATGISTASLPAHSTAEIQNLNLWWIDLRMFAGPVAISFLTALVGACFFFALKPAMSLTRKRITCLLLFLTAAIVTLNMLNFFRLMLAQQIDVSVLLPLSLPIALTLAWLCWQCWASAPYDRKLSTHKNQHASQSVTALQYESTSHRNRNVIAFKRFTLACTVIAVLVVGFPLAQMFCFGKTDYRRRAEIAVVFGAGVYPDGRLSVALADRVRTAIELYHDGTVNNLLFSGGPGMGDTHETVAMKNYAMAKGVPQSAILLDPNGLSTHETVKHTNPILDKLGAKRVLAVSHFYHLPRIKMAYQRTGREVYTVPAKESYTLKAMPLYLPREVAAFWYYYLPQ